VAARTGKLNELGAELFLLYAQLNETMRCAEDIVQSLRVYANRMARHLEHGDDPPPSRPATGSATRSTDNVSRSTGSARR
jgi:hypothetical protein